MVSSLFEPHPSYAELDVLKTEVVGGYQYPEFWSGMHIYYIVNPPTTMRLDYREKVINDLAAALSNSSTALAVAKTDYENNAAIANYFDTLQFESAVAFIDYLQDEIDALVALIESTLPSS